jgi:hypothetical protein
MRSRLVVALALLCGCGRGLATPDYVDDLAVVHGTLSIPPGFATGNLSIALLWLGFGTSGAGQVQQAASVRADALGGFRLDVTTLPPASAVFAAPDTSFAQGAIVAYDDVDGDGRLDIEPPGVPSRDRVLGKSYDTRVFFLASGAPSPASNGFQPARRGLSLVHLSQLAPAPGSCAHVESGALVEDPCMFVLDQPATLDPGAAVTVELRDDAHLQGYACSYFWGSEDWPDFFSMWNDWSPLAASLCRGSGCDCVGSGCALDVPPAGAAVTCASDGTSYVYVTCVDDPSLCGTRFCHYGHGERAAGGTAPAGWPCP